jgi:hypothetical protein
MMVAAKQQGATIPPVGDGIFTLAGRRGPQGRETCSIIQANAGEAGRPTYECDLAVNPP